MINISISILKNLYNYKSGVPWYCYSQREPRSTPYCRSATSVIHLQKRCRVRCTPLAQLTQMYCMCTCQTGEMCSIQVTIRVLLSIWQVYRQEYTLLIYTLLFHLGWLTKCIVYLLCHQKLISGLQVLIDHSKVMQMNLS